MSLASIFDDIQITFFCQFDQGRHVGRLPIQMNRDNGLSAGCDGFIDRFRRQRVASGIDIGEDGHRAGKLNACGGGDKGIGGRDYFVAWPDVEGAEDELQGIGARGHTDGMLAMAIGGKFLLEFGDSFAENEIASRYAFLERRAAIHR